MPDPLTIGLGVLALVGTAGAASAGWGWRLERRDREEADADLEATRVEVSSLAGARARALDELADVRTTLGAAQADLAAARADLAAARAEAARAAAGLAAQTTRADGLHAELLAARADLARECAAHRDAADRLARLELWRREAEETGTRDAAQLRQQAEQARRAAEEAGRAEEAARRELARLREALRDTETSVGALQLELRARRLALVTAEDELALHVDALALLGVPLSGRAHDPLATERRAPSRAVLADLVTTATVRAAALVDGRGLPLLGVGAEPAVDQVARAGGVLDELLPALEAALEQPLALFSLGDGRSAAHLLRPSDTRVALGVVTTGDAPFAQLRAAQLRLVGRPPAPPVYAEVPGLVGEAVEARDARLEDALVAWGRRTPGAEATLLDPAGTVRAAWGPVRPAASLFRRAVAPLVARARRDGSPLSTLELEARGERAALAARFVGDRPDALLLLVRSPAPLGAAALDALATSLRWMRPVPARPAA